MNDGNARSTEEKPERTSEATALADIRQKTQDAENQQKTGQRLPQVSVLMTVWNSELYLREAIESVLAQRTTAAYELLLVDDGSDDSSVRIALEYVERNEDRVRLLRHPGGGNRGISASRNLGLRHARGTYLTFLDADDVWLPHCVESQLQAFAACPEASMVYGAAERWCDTARPFDEAAARSAWWGQNYIPPVVPAGEHAGLLHLGQLLDWYLEDEAMVPCICSVMLRTDVARAVGGFEEQFRGLYDDQAFHAKVALAHPVFAHADCVARYRQHADSCCAEARADEQKQQRARASFLDWLARYRHTLTRTVRFEPEAQPLSGEPV